MDNNAILNILIKAKDEASAVISDVGKSLENAEKGSKIFLGAITAAGAAMAGVAVTSVNTAARTETLGVALEAVAKSTGTSMKVLEEQEAVLKKQGITTQEARTTLIKFLQSELDVAEAAKVARVAQDLAVIGGENSSETTAKLTEAIANQNVLMLRQYGIVTNANDIFDSYGKTIGKAGSNLTEAEKKQAFVNLILEQGTKVAGTYEAAMGTAGKQLGSMSRYIQEAQNAIGAVFLPTFTKLIFATNDFLKTITPENVEKFKQALERLAPFFPVIAGAIIGGVLPALWGMAAALWAAMVPLLPWIAAGAAIGLVIAGLIVVIQNWGNIMTTVGNVIGSVFNTIATTVTTVVTQIWTAITGFFTTIYEAVVLYLTNIYTFWSTIFTAIWGVVSYILNFIYTAWVFIFQSIWAFVQIVFWGIYTVISDALNAVWSVIGTTVTNIYNAVVSWFTAVWNFIVSIFNQVKEFISKTWNAISTSINTTLNQIHSAFSERFNAVKNTVTSIFSSLHDWFSDKLNSFWSIVDGVTKKVVSAFQWLSQQVQNALHAIKFPHLNIGSGKVSVGGHEISYPTISVDWYKQGGWVKNTGLAVVHEGEYVMSKDMLAGRTPVSSQVMNNNNSRNSDVNITAIINNPLDFDLVVNRLTYALNYNV